MQTRVTTRLERGDTVPPGMPVIETGDGCAEDVAWLLRHGAVQILCLPIDAPVPSHVVIHTPDPQARDGTFAVAASLLRHVPAESLYLAIHSSETPEGERGTDLRELLDARSAALARHGLDLRTEARYGEITGELLRELTAHEPAMLVLGVGEHGSFESVRLTELLEGNVQRPVLIVRPVDADGDGSR
jgi:hypothetical protein